MLQYVVKRILLMIPTMIAISIIVFTIIQLPPGNYLESYIAELQAQGESVDPQKIAFLREYYGLDKPLIEQYLRWAGGMLRGDFGYSFEFNMPGGSNCETICSCLIRTSSFVEYQVRSSFHGFRMSLYAASTATSAPSDRLPLITR